LASRANRYRRDERVPCRRVTEARVLSLGLVQTKAFNQRRPQSPGGGIERAPL
jgi:hypothetical protein